MTKTKNNTPPKLTISQLKKNSLSSIARSDIEQMIFSGELEAGSRLSESALAVTLGISRGPIREACRALVEFGLLDLVPGKGVYIRQLDVHDAEEIYDVRAGLLGLAGFLLAPKVDESHLAKLKALQKSMVVSSTSEELRALNSEFHELTVEFTGNSRLIKAYDAAVKEFSLFRAGGTWLDARPENQVDTIKEHQRIILALESRDPDAAYAAHMNHVISGKRRMLSTVVAQSCTLMQE